MLHFNLQLSSWKQSKAALFSFEARNKKAFSKYKKRNCFQFNVAFAFDKLAKVASSLTIKESKEISG